MKNPMTTATLTLSLGAKSTSYDPYWNKMVSESYTVEEARTYFIEEAGRLLGEDWEILTIKLEGASGDLGEVSWEAVLTAFKVVD